jgi:hypothetical protein
MAHYPEPLTESSLATPPARRNNFWYVRRDPSEVLVFVHGIFSDSRGCWLFKDPTSNRAVFWPDLVRNDRRFDNTSIYLAGYHTQIDAGDFPIAQCAREIRDALRRTEATGADPVMAAKTLIFVCHSTGGIVLRYLLERNCSEFSQKNIGLALIASPSLGSIWANAAQLAARYYNQKLGLQLRWGNDSLTDLHGRFRDLVNDRATRMPGLFGMEACETKFILKENIAPFIRNLLPNRWKVVSTLSAGQYFGEVKYIRDNDHFSIVKPDSSDHPTHEFLVTFFQEFRKFLQTKPVGDPQQKGRDIYDINERLNDLLLAPRGGIRQLLEGYAENQTDERWREIKTRAKTNHDKMEDLYKGLNNLEVAKFFGRYPRIKNDIERVIAAKEDGFYHELRRHPDAPRLTDRRDIADLIARAKRLEESERRVIEAQDAISKYIGENEDDLRRLLSLVKQQGLHLPGASRDLVYISYKTADNAWRLSLRRLLDADNRVQVWDDSKLVAGDDWEDHIKEAVRRTKVMIILASQEYLASSLPTELELEPAVEAARAGNLKLLWVPVRKFAWQESILKRSWLRLIQTSRSSK